MPKVNDLEILASLFQNMVAPINHHFGFEPGITDVMAI